MHFDDSESWKVDPWQPGGIDLFTVAAHEFGHNLGLAHSDDSNSLMAPIYKPPSPDRDIITQDDITAIQVSTQDDITAIQVMTWPMSLQGPHSSRLFV